MIFPFLVDFNQLDLKLRKTFLSTVNKQIIIIIIMMIILIVIHLIVYVYGVNQENQEVRGVQYFLCNPSDGNLLCQSSRTPTTELPCKNSQRAKHIDCFRKRVPPQTSDWILNAGPTRGVKVVWVECKCMVIVDAGQWCAWK